MSQIFYRPVLYLSHRDGSLHPLLMEFSDHLVLREQQLAPATEWSPPHGGWVFLRLVDGEGMVLGNGGSHLVGSGEVIMCRPGRACRLRASRLGPLRVQYFGVEADLLSGVLSAWERQHLDSLGERVIVQQFAADHPLARQFADLAGAGRAPRLAQRCQMLQLVAPILMAHLPESPPPTVALTSAQARFRQLVQQLPESELIRLRPAELARRCGCSVRHFSRLFRAHFGRSFKPRQNELRLEKACELLRETNAKIIEVALESGFQHVGLFTASFKRRFGMTPSMWRRRHQRRGR